MSITLAELCEIPHLGLTPVAGVEHLRRKVEWTHVSEMEDPTPWLEGGELLMSVGLRFPPFAEAQVHYLERLSRRGVCGFAIADVMVSKLTPELEQAADRLQLPLMVVAQEVSFIEVVRTVAFANEGGAQRRLMTHINIFDTLQWRLATGATTAELLARVSGLIGYDIYVAGPDGKPLLDEIPTPPEDIARKIPRPLERATSIGDAHVLPVVVAGAMIGQLIVVERPGTRSGGLVAVQHASTIVALEVEGQLRSASIADGYRARLMEQLIGGELAGDAVRRELTAEGFDPESDAVLMAIAPLSEGRLDDRMRLALHAGLGRVGIAYLSVELDAYYLLIGDDRGALDTVFEQPEVRVGMSRAFRPADGAGLARREALLALQVARRTNKRLVRRGRDADHPATLPPDLGSLRRLVQSTLGPLLEYDRVHQTALVLSVRRYLERDRSLSAAARDLFVHPNSLAYRLRRVDEITGRRLANVATQTDFWLALEAQRILALSGDDDDSRARD